MDVCGFLKTTSNINGFFKSGAAPLYHSLVTSLDPVLNTAHMIISIATRLAVLTIGSHLNFILVRQGLIDPL